MSNPPREKNFKAHLEWHLFVNGTRPEPPFERWTKKNFCEALEKARNRLHKSAESKGDARRSLNLWLNGTMCLDQPWGVLVEHLLFGRPGDHPEHNAWRRSFQEARTAHPQEPHRAARYFAAAVRGARILAAKTDEALTKHGWRVDRADKGEACTRPDFNIALVVSQPTIALRVLSDPWLAQKHYHEDLEAFVLAEIGKKSGDYMNDKKIRLAGDFIGCEVVDIQETEYLSSLMTDQLGWAQVQSKELLPDGSPELVLRGHHTFVDPVTGNLKRFDENLISNQVGASTLAFSRDGHLMVVVQNDRNLQSQNWLAPSGSGSLDWEDVAASGASDLIKLIQYGAQRELQEECALGTDGGDRVIASKVMVTGFARMLHRAGKPEFFCLGRIDATAAEIRARKPERYVDRVFAAPVGRADSRSVRPTTEIARICEAYLAGQVPVPMSYPLEHGLQLLAELCAHEAAAEAISEFMWDDTWCAMSG